MRAAKRSSVRKTRQRPSRRPAGQLGKAFWLRTLVPQSARWPHSLCRRMNNGGGWTPHYAVYAKVGHLQATVRGQNSDKENSLGGDTWPAKAKGRPRRRVSVVRGKGPNFADF
uniref:Uncharacterized protein n=1 Tax=Trichuris muris TaxID=70415 RepID=A0A5S6QZB4_TRIMR